MEMLAAGVAGGLFGYNRENFFFDGEQRIKREYQGQLMRVKQFELFREDIRDLMELTVAKMDNYLIVNTIQIGLVVVLFTEGRPQPGVSPPWLLFLWAATGVGSMMYITLCIWLAMHASICSHSFCVRMLTQLVRLPIPSKEQMDAARVLATDFEGAQTREMFRVPVVKEQLKKLQRIVDQDAFEEDAADASADISNDAAAEETMLDSAGQPVATDTLSHVKLYRRMQANWQAYDAYARVSMALGTNQFLQQLGYTCLIGFVSENGSVLPGMSSVLIFSVCAALLVRLDLYVSSYSLILALVLNTLPPFITGVCLILHSVQNTYLNLLGDTLVPIPVFLHIMWLLVLLLWAQGKTINGIALPTTFRAVLYLDVFGWLSSSRQEETSWTRQQTHRSVEEEAAGTGATASFRLSVVREEEPLHSENVRVPFLPNPGAEEGRRGLKTSLARLCRELKAELQRDLCCFEQEGLASLMSDYDQEEVKDLRRLMERLDAKLQEAAPETEEVTLPSQADSVWLKLEWNTAGHGMAFYRRVDSEDTSIVWTEPPAPAKILEMHEVRQRMEGLEAKVQMLASQFPAREEEESIASGPSSSSCSVAPEQLSRPVGSASSTTSGEVDSLWHGAPDLEAGGPPSAQETRFGGSDAAVQLTESEVRQRSFRPNEAAAGGFHPHRVPESRGERDRQKEPGRLPWSTVQQGSLVLIAAWCAGFVWTVLRLMTDVVDILKPPKPLPPHPDLGLVFAGPWPQFFEPEGLSCQMDGSQPMFWLVEKYTVHQLVADQSWTLRTSPQEAACLSKAPEFHSSGLRGISLRCSDVTRKEACLPMLVGADGNVLLCNHTMQRLHLRGDASHVAASSDASGLWAKRSKDLSAGPALYRPLESRNASVAEYVSTLELGQQPVARNQHWMDMLEDGGLLALSDLGVLHAWRPVANSALWLPSGWFFNLPELGLRWRGLCTVGRTAFLLGKSKTAAGRVELWKMQLPS